jgi:hypothetical protein
MRTVELHRQMYSPAVAARSWCCARHQQQHGSAGIANIGEEVRSRTEKNDGSRRAKTRLCSCCTLLQLHSASSRVCV